MKLFYGSLLFFISSISYSTEMKNVSTQNNEIHLESQFSKKDPIIPLIINVGSSSKIYEDYKWAIKIARVVADGKVIEAERSGVVFDEVNYRSISVSTNTFIYKIRFDDLLVGDLSPDGEYSLTKYSIPYDVKILDITYQFVYPDGRKNLTIYLLRLYRVGSL